MTSPTTASGNPEDLRAQSLGRLAVDVPGATALFRENRLDFCCNGERSLETACSARGLDVSRMEAELRMLMDRLTGRGEPEALSAPMLIEHILSRFHEVHREQLPELIRLARRVEAVHKEHPQCPTGLADRLESMHDELLAHMTKEEEVLFPMMRTLHPAVPTAIRMMRMEHHDHGDQLEHLKQLTAEFNPPQDACRTWLALYASLAQFADDLVEHIHLENNRLFPVFEVA